VAPTAFTIALESAIAVSCPKWPVESIASLLLVDVSTLRRWLSGATRPADRETIDRIGRALDVSLVAAWQSAEQPRRRRGAAGVVSAVEADGPDHDIVTVRVERAAERVAVRDIVRVVVS